jgi:hypothetical protein
MAENRPKMTENGFLKNRRKNKEKKRHFVPKKQQK